MLSIALILVSFASLKAQSPGNYNAKGWEMASAYLTETMNRAVKPCDNFTGFMCGNFGNASDTETYQMWEDQRTRHHLAVLRTAIEGINLNSTKTPKYARAVRSFYDRCLVNKFDLSTIKPLYIMVSDALGPYPPFGESSSSKTSNKLQDDVWYLLGKAQKEFGEALAIKASVSTFFSERRQISYVKLEPQVPTGAADLENLRNMTLQAAALFKIEVNVTYLDEVLSETETFLQDWQEASSSADSTQYASVVGNLSTAFPNVTWSSYWKGLLDEAGEKWLESGDEAGVIISDRGVMLAVSEVFSRHSTRAIKTAMYSWFLRSLQTEYSGQSMEDMKGALWVSLGATRDELCLDYAIRQMAPAAARVYFDDIGEDIMKWRNQVILIGRNVFSAMRLLLNSVDYLSPATKERINERLDTITMNPGVPSWIMDDRKVLSHSGDYNESEPLFMNDVRGKREQFLDQLKLLADPQNAEDPPPTFELNAQFDPMNKKVTLFLGHTLPPIFSLSYPLAVKYGRFGVMIGHELMHGVDLGNKGIDVDQGQKILEDDELEVYERQEQCVVQQYSSTCYKKLEGCLIGSKAIRDNIADIGGLKAAFAAYQFAKAVMADEPPVPDLIEYDGDKLFFMTYQRYYCTRNEPAGWLTVDHTPNSARAPVALRNNPHFAAAFKCEVNSDAAPIKICPMWGDILES